MACLSCKSAFGTLDSLRWSTSWGLAAVRRTSLDNGKDKLPDKSTEQKELLASAAIPGFVISGLF